MTSTHGSAGPTGETMPPPSADGPGPAAPASRPGPSPRVLRFARAVRWTHQTTAVLMGVCVGTALCLYVPVFAELVGRRRLMVTVHEWSGLLLPVPLLLGMISRALRADLRRLNRFGPHDRRWLRAAVRSRRVRPRPGEPGGRDAGKFNAGQKVYAAWIAGAVLVMTGTGVLMWFTGLAPLVWRTSATFLHDWLALAIGVALVSHVGLAVGEPEARRAMRTGEADRSWARFEHPLWDPDEGDEEQRRIPPHAPSHPRPRSR
jgi:formate dehydrogenase subunit gamma